MTWAGGSIRCSYCAGRDQSTVRRPPSGVLTDIAWSNRMDTRLDLVVEYMDAARLCPFGSNARTHSKKQIRQLADSSRTFGFTNPILIDDTRTILAGHGRVEAAKLLGMTSIPCVRLSNMTAAQNSAYVLAAN